MQKFNCGLIVLVIVCFCVLVVCCGGGAAGGAGGVSLSESEYTTHNPGGWGGGGGSSNGGGGGSSGGSSGETNVSVQGGTPLTVTGYTYGNQTYTTVEALTQAMTASGATGTFTVPFTIASGETRQARVTATAEGFLVEHQYKATCVIPGGTQNTEILYYKNSGLNLASLTTANMSGWQGSNGVIYSGSSISGLQGDITLTAVYNAPNCVITVTPPGTATETAADSGIYEITNISNSFSLLVGLADGTSIPAGTTTSWQVNGTTITNGTLPETCSAAPNDVGITEATIGTNSVNATPMNISCTVTLPDNPTPAVVTKLIKVYKKVTLPTPTITITAPETASAVTTGRYALTVPADAFTFTAAPSGGGSFPTGTVFNWTITVNNSTTFTKTGQTVTATPTEGGVLSTQYGSPTSWEVKCEVSHADMTNASAPYTTQDIELYQVPALKMSVGTPSDASSFTGDIYKIANLTNQFSFSVKEEDDSSVSDATGFQWYVGGNPVSGATSATFSATPTVLGLAEATIGTNQAGANSIEVKCVVTRPNGNTPVIKTIKVYKQPVIPGDFSINVTEPTSATESSADHYAVTSLTDVFNLSASGTFPNGTTFTWTITGSSGPVTKTDHTQTVTLGPTDAGGTLSTNYNSPTSKIITCVAHHDDAAVQDVTKSKTIYLYKLPAGKINVSPVGLESVYAGGIYQLANLTNNITFEASNEDGSSFPDGTTFTWSVNGTPVSGLTDELAVAPSVLGLNESTIAGTDSAADWITVSFVATRPDGTTTGTSQVKFYMPITLPDFTASVTMGSIYYDSACPKDANGYIIAYAMKNLTDSIQFEANGSFPDGTTFDWTIGGTTLNGASQHGRTISLSLSAMGYTADSGSQLISRSSTSPTVINIECTAKHNAAPPAGKDAQAGTLKVFLLKIPDITVTLSSPPTGLTTDANGAYLVSTADLTSKNFGFTVSPTFATMPNDVKYTWTIGDTELNSTPYTDQTISKTLSQLGVTTIPTSLQTLTVKCTASHDALPSGSKYNDVDIKIMGKPTVSFDARSGTPVPADQTVVSGGTATAPATNPAKTGYTFLGWYTSSDGGTTLSSTPYNFSTPVTADLTLYAKWRGEVYMDTGVNINSILTSSSKLKADSSPNKTFSASATPPAVGTQTYEFSTADSPTAVVAWLDTDGTSIKYYAEGYTDTGTKIMLNADSHEIFDSCGHLNSIDVRGFDTSNVTNMENMFYYAGRNASPCTIIGLDGFDTSKVTNMKWMFHSCGCTVLDLSSFDTSEVTNMDAMFGGAKAQTIYASSSFVTTKLSNLNNSMFASCDDILGDHGTSYDGSNNTAKGAAYAHLDGGESNPGYFSVKQ